MIPFFAKTSAQYPLLRRLFLLQLVVFVLGIVLAAVASQVVQKIRSNSRLTESKERLRTALSTKQESLRAWKQMGLDDAVEAVIRPIRESNKGVEISVVSRGELANTSDREVLVPDHDDGLSEYVVVGKVPAIRYGGLASRFESAMIFWIAGIYLAMVAFQLYYVRKYFYAPLLRFEAELNSHAPRETVDISGIPARGEIRRFLEAFKTSVDKTLLAERQATLVEVSTRLAHDIRSPLTALQHLQPTFEKLAKREADLVQQIINRINQIVESLLVARRNELLVQNRLHPFLNNLVSQKKLEWTKKNINWKLGCDPELSLRANAKSIADLERSLSNLINNSAEAIGENGKIEIMARKHDSGLEITVVDNGKGIDQSVLAELGSRPAVSNKKDGNGLGVWYAKRFAEAHGGALRISSQMGKGTQVALILNT